MYIGHRIVNRLRFVSDNPPDYRVGYKKLPLHGRFKEGQPGNPEGGRRRRPLTRRQAVVMALVEKSAGGNLRAGKLLPDLVLKTELAAPPPDRGRPARLPRPRTRPPRRRQRRSSDRRDRAFRGGRRGAVATLTMGFAALNPSYASLKDTWQSWTSIR
jgi:hypothetical protein